jgi:UDPglucose 6-dehydrogenase
MVKYVTNIHLAVKVALANEFYQICQALDSQGANIDYDKVIEYATLDKRLGNSHWKVPGPMPADDTGEPAFGFGGSCFVKDINALISIAKTLGIDPKVMNGAWHKNMEVRPQRDWEKLIGRAISKKSKG